MIKYFIKSSKIIVVRMCMYLYAFIILYMYRHQPAQAKSPRFKRVQEQDTHSMIAAPKKGVKKGSLERK